MNLDAVFNAFVNPQTILLCLGVWIMTYVIRTVVEALWKGAKGNLLWEEIFIPLGAIFNGGLLGGVLKTFVWPDIVSHSLSGRIMYGAICGVFSGFVYGRVRSWIGALGGNTPTPPAPSPDPAPLPSEPKSAPDPAPVPAPAPSPDPAPPLGGRGDDKTAA